MRWALIAVGLAGCFDAPAGGLPCGGTLGCPLGQACVAGTCQASGVGDAAPADAMTTCGACEDDVLVSCTGERTDCPLGCVAVGTTQARCAELAPSNDVPVELAGTDAEVMLAGVLDSDTGVIRDNDGRDLRGPGQGVIAGVRFATVDQAGTQGLGVFTAHRVVIDDLRVIGTRALAVVADEIVVAGRLDVSATSTPPANLGGAGPGGSPGRAVDLPVPDDPCAGRDGVHASTVLLPDSGGGGGAGGENGGDGGDGATSPNPPGGAGGAACLGPELEPLRGGGGGGAGGSLAPVPACRGGGGGGAVQLTGLREIELRQGGLVIASGGGGTGGAPNSLASDSGGGCGGGGGGAILVETPTLTVAGALGVGLYANGGGGGGAGSFSIGQPGQAGAASSIPAPGGVGVGGGVGGAGGAGTSQAQVGASGQFNGAGGGGGVGRIIVRFAAGQLPLQASPAITMLAPRTR